MCAHPHKRVSMHFIKLFLITGMLTLFPSLNAGIYLEKPINFNPKAAVVGCCYLHYQDKILLLHRQDSKAEGNRWVIPGGKLD